MSLSDEKFGNIVNSITFDADLKQLKILGDVLRASIKKQRNKIAEKMKRELSKGDRVLIIGGKKLDGVEGDVEEIKRTRADVYVPSTFKTWTVPLSMLEIIKEESDD